MNEALFRQLQDSVTRQAGDEAWTTLAPLIDELWAERERQLARETRFRSADAIGAMYVARAQSGSIAVSQVLLGGRALVELAEESKSVDPAGARRLQALVDEAAVQVAAAVEKSRKARRGQWLSFLAHELKNPLNTILNALWLLRERGSDKKTAGRFVELAERAVKRIEGRIADMRALDEQLVAAPPGWEALHGNRSAEPAQDADPGAEKSTNT
jgi:signal transduction histidine kinase